MPAPACAGKFGIISGLRQARWAGIVRLFDKFSAQYSNKRIEEILTPAIGG